MRIGIVVGEASGDILGAGLVNALKKHYPDATFEGIGGPKMSAAGFNSLFPMERLAVIGLIEPLKRLGELLGIRKQLKAHFLVNKPDVFIGIDAPDFTLNLETYLKKNGIKTVHYVSPSVWAWRKKRVYKVAKAAHLLLSLFPFEEKWYSQTDIKVKCVGHTLADQIPLENNMENAQQILGVELNKQYVALLPGSRKNEVAMLIESLLESAERMRAQTLFRNAHFLIPAANKERKLDIEQALKAFPNLPVTLVDGHSHEVMAASELVIMASGTTTLEALLLKRPMVIIYKMAALSYFIISRMAVTQYVGLPNLLAPKPLIPELLQENASAENICREAVAIMSDKDKQSELQRVYLDVHHSIRKNANEAAAIAVKELIESEV